MKKKKMALPHNNTSSFTPCACFAGFLQKAVAGRPQRSPQLGALGTPHANDVVVARLASVGSACSAALVSGAGPRPMLRTRCRTPSMLFPAHAAQQQFAHRRKFARRSRIVCGFDGRLCSLSRRRRGRRSHHNASLAAAPNEFLRGHEIRLFARDQANQTADRAAQAFVHGTDARKLRCSELN